MRSHGISPAELAQRLGQPDAPVVVDVRSRQEYDRGHVPDAINVPYDEIGTRAGEIASIRGEEIVVYCGHGPRAWIAAARLRRLGFRRIVYLRGHWRGWQNARLHPPT